jgi:hypothetical protein
VYQRQLTEFAAALGDGILHGSKEVFDFLESLDLDDDNLKYNDKLILTSVLLKAKELKESGAGRLFFASMDKSDLQPTAHRPKMARYYHEAGLVFVANFVLPDRPRIPPARRLFRVRHDGRAENWDPCHRCGGWQVSYGFSASPFASAAWRHWMNGTMHEDPARRCLEGPFPSCYRRPGQETARRP